MLGAQIGTLTDPKGSLGTSRSLCILEPIQRLGPDSIQIGKYRIEEPANGTIYSEQTFALLTFTAGAVAAYLMYRRGESPLSIAKNTLLDPIGSLASEIQNTTSENHA